MIWRICFFLTFLQPLLCFIPANATVANPFVGNLAFGDSELEAYLARKGLDVTICERWEDEDSKRAVRLLSVYYEDRGFPFHQIQVEMAEGRPILRISEGPRARLYEIRFCGNHAFSEGQLADFFRLGEWFNQSAINQAVTAIRTAYRSTGYLRAQVNASGAKVVELDRPDRFPFPFRHRAENVASIKCEISEGAKFSLGKVQIPSPFDQIEFCPPSPGSEFREEALLGFRKRVEDHIAQQGKFLKEFQILQHIDDTTHRVDLTARIQFYPALVARKIEFTGNSRFPDSFYRRELSIEEEQILRPQQLRESLKCLAETGTLSRLSPNDVELVVNEPSLSVDIVFHLHEKGRQWFAYELGRGSFGGLEASLLYSLFGLLRLGETFGFELTAGDHTTGFALQLASRCLIGTDIPASFALGFFKRHHGLRLPGIDDEILGILGRGQAGLSTSLTYRIRRSQKAGFDLTRQTISTPQQSSSRNVIIEPYWRREYAAKGYFHCSQRFSFFQGEKRSWNLRPTLRIHREGLSEEGPVSKLRFRLGASHAIFRGARPPLSERLFIRESDLRGFGLSGPWGVQNGDLTQIGGDTLLTLSGEYPVSLSQSVSIVPFGDVGWNTSLAEPAGFQLVEGTNRVVRASTGSEVRMRVLPRLPAARLIFSWNPLRLKPIDGASLMAESRFRIRLSFDH